MTQQPNHTTRLTKLHTEWLKRWPDMIPEPGQIKSRLGEFVVKSIVLKLGAKSYLKFIPTHDIDYLHPAEACALLRKELTKNSDPKLYPYPSSEGAVLLINGVNMASWIPQQGGLLPTLECHSEFQVALVRSNMCITWPFEETKPKGLK